MTNVELKSAIDTAITSETTAASVSPTDVGSKMKEVVDYVDQEVGAAAPTYLEYVAKLTKTGGTGTTATFSLTEFVNTLGQTLVPVNDTVNCVITEDETANFLNETSTVEIWDSNYLNTVVIKFSIASLNQIQIFSYYEGFHNINFTDGLFIRIKKYIV
jgi:hypothetical protein